MTAIPYVNATPHIGNVLTTLAGDITARFHRLAGEDVFYVAGTDENGLKIKEAAEAQGKDPHVFAKEVGDRFIEIFRSLEMQCDDFVRTTEQRHIETSQRFFKALQDKGHIYKSTYTGWYDVSTETFFKEDDLVDGKSPDGNPVKWVEEENYFFKLSAFEKPLLKHIEKHPLFIIPESRRNEVVSFIKQGLRDAAISRQNPGWGIPVPGDDQQVIYVWFEALINYITSTGWPKPGWEDKWPPIVQWLGKDILTRFHATLWPAMLMGLDLPLPEVVAAHAWILIGGEKLSKSKGNIIEPLPLAADLAERSGCAPIMGVEAVRYYLASTMPYENDSVFTYEDFDRHYNSDLANDLGNALNRTLSMAHKFVGGTIPDARAEEEALAAIAAAKDAVALAMSEFRIDHATHAAWEVVRFVNKYIDTRAPWALAKNNDPLLPAVMKSMLLCLRASEGLVRFVMPATADEIARQLGLPPTKLWSEIGTLDSVPAGVKVAEPKPIFPRLEAKKKPMETETQTKQQQPKQEAPPTAEIGIEDFAKVQLRVARVLEAEPLEGSDKLLKLQVVIGKERRQIVAGIRKNYQPTDLIGRQIVVVANLKPAKLRGTESQGMLLAAVDEDGGAILLQPERDAPEGAPVR